MSKPTLRPARQTNYTELVSYRLSPNMKARIDKMAAEQGVKPPDVVRWCLEYGLDALELDLADK
jgi:predicted DNA-binding protein